MIKFCSLSSGSEGNSIFIGTDKGKLIVDCGIGIRKMESTLREIGENPGDVTGILVSHEHCDHTKSLNSFSRKYNIPVYLNYETMNAVGCDTEKCIIFKNNDEFEAAGFGIKAFSVPHDARDAVGFIIQYGGKKIVIATDMGHVKDDFMDFIGTSEILFLESNHDENMLKAGPYPYWLKKRILGDKGHLSNLECSKVIAQMAEKGTKRFILGHLSRKNNFPQLAFETTRYMLHEADIKIDTDVTLEVAGQDCAGNILYV